MNRTINFIYFVILLSIKMLAQSPEVTTTVVPTQTVTTVPQNEQDDLKARLKEISSQINKIQQNVQDANTPKKKTDVIQEIEKKQVQSVRLSALFIDRFAQGASATDAILNALETGATMGQLSSPFVSPTFTKKYDNWIDKWGKFIPAVLVPGLALSLQNLNADQKLASIPIGITLTGVIGAISGGTNKKQKEKIENAAKEFQSTLDLFDLNRLVYSDIQKLKAYIHSAKKADSTLTSEFISFQQLNKNLVMKSDIELRNDSTMGNTINKTQVFISRFQVKLTKIKFVLDHVESMLASYYNRTSIRDYKAESASTILTETKSALDNLSNTYIIFKKNWNELQGTFYQLSPEELRKLDSYYMLENLKFQTQAIK